MEIKYLRLYKTLNYKIMPNLKNLDLELSLTEYKFKKSYFGLNQPKKDIKLIKGVIFLACIKCQLIKKVEMIFFMIYIKE